MATQKVNERHHARHQLEYRAVRGLSRLLVKLPHRCACALAVGLSVIGYAVMAKRRREAARRVRLVFGESLTAREVSHICWISFRNMVLNAVEMIRVKQISQAQIDEMMPDLKTVLDALRKLKAESDGRGVVAALPHMGNWDLAGSGCFLSGLPIFSVAGRQRNPQMNDLLNQLRSGHGMEILERGSGALVQILKRIKAGQIFAILPDTRSPTPDLLIPFLGGAANLARGMASFAFSANVPILPVIMHRTDWFHFTLKVYPAVWPNKAADKDCELERMTREVIAIVDAAIQEAPEQWFWYNKRWVLDPVETTN